VSARSALAVVLRVSAVVLAVYFTCSHWFFPHQFFRALGIMGPEPDSDFVLSQLRLIGAMVAGYAVVLWIIARDIERFRPILGVVLLVGTAAVGIFVGQVVMGTLPRPFLVNAGLLALQVFIVLALRPWRGLDTGARGGA
jgi:hypothetical protein